MSVGFVDLVGFTTLAHRVSPTELAASSSASRTRPTTSRPPTTAAS
jgi:hypothetical protein